MRSFKIVLLLWLLPCAGFAGTPTVDTNQTGSCTSCSSTAAAALTTSNTNEIIYVGVFSEKAGSSFVLASGVTDTAGLTYTHRYTGQGVIVDNNDGAGRCAVSIDTYTAPATSIVTGDVITGHLAASSDTVGIIAIAVAGVFSTASPFDTNVSVPAQNFAVGPASTQANVTGISTNQAHDLLSSWVATANNNTLGAGDVSWTSIAIRQLPSGSACVGWFAQIYKGFSATLSGSTQTPASPTQGWVIQLDAVSGDAAPSGCPNTLASMGVGC